MFGACRYDDIDREACLGEQTDPLWGERWLGGHHGTG